MTREHDFDIDALYVALDTRRASRGLSWAGVARAAGGWVSPSTIHGIRSRRALEADGVLQMLLWLDRSPESFMPS